MIDRSFEEFVAEESPGLLRTAYLLTGRPGAARDLLQTGLIAVYRHGDRLADPLGHARREMVAAHVGWRTRVRVGDLLADSPLLAGTRGLPGFSQPPPDVPARDELSSALAQLPPRLRAALVLRHGAQLPVAALADALGARGEDVAGLTGLAVARLGALLGGSPADDAALVERLRRELPRLAAAVGEPGDIAAHVVVGARSQRHHLVGLLAVLVFLVLVVVLTVLTV